MFSGINISGRFMSSDSTNITLKNLNNPSLLPAAQLKKNFVLVPVDENSDTKMQDAFISSKKKLGVFDKIFTKILPFGYSESNVKKKLQEYNLGLVDEQEVQNSINRYISASNYTSESIIDMLSMSAGFGAGFAVKKVQTFVNIFTKKYNNKASILTAGVSIAAGSLAKLGLKTIDSARKNKAEQNEKDKLNIGMSSIINGAAGYFSILNPLLIPASIMISAFARYVNNNDNSFEPSISEFFAKQKDSIAAVCFNIAGFSAIALRGHADINKISNSIKASVINKKHSINYRPPSHQLTVFQQLARDIGYDVGVIIKDEKFVPEGLAKLDYDFIKILLEKGENGNIDVKIKKLELENIFLPKYLQTVIDIPDAQQVKLCKQVDELLEAHKARKDKKFYNGRDFNFNLEDTLINTTLNKLEEMNMDINGVKDLQGILKKIKSKCSVSRTLEQAQLMLNKEYDGRFVILKPCGVGSVAETYIAKDNHTNEEVVIKIIKDYFISENKIAKDKTKILQKIEERSKEDNSSYMFDKQTITTAERKQYDINQVNNMFEVWSGEINLKQESEAAQAVASQAQNFNSVAVIDSKQNIFAMEKAKGIQLDSNNLVKEWQAEKLNEADFKNFVENYVKVYCEQLFSIPKSGNKVVQSDPHCGNIYVNLADLRDITNCAKPITIIDYGNTTKTSREEAIKNLFNHLDYIVGNTESIAEAMLEGAELGKQNKNSVIKELSCALEDNLYNTDTKIDVDNPVKIFSTVNNFCLEFMQNKNIIPNASHINQMKAEETYIISNLGCLKNIADLCKYDLNKSIDRNAIIKLLVSEMAKATEDAMKVEPVLTFKEISKRYNFFIKHPEKALSCLGINFDIV